MEDKIANIEKAMMEAVRNFDAVSVHNAMKALDHKWWADGGHRVPSPIDIANNVQYLADRALMSFRSSGGTPTSVGSGGITVYIFDYGVHIVYSPPGCWKTSFVRM